MSSTTHIDGALTKTLEQRIAESQVFGNDIPAFNKLPPELLDIIFGFVSRGARIIGWTCNEEYYRRLRHSQYPSANMSGLRWAINGILFTCRRLRREILRYFKFHGLWYCDTTLHFIFDTCNYISPVEFSDRSVHLRNIRHLQIDLTHPVWRRWKPSQLIRVMTETFRNLDYLCLATQLSDSHPCDVEHRRSAPGRCSHEKCRCNIFARLLRISSFIIARHPQLHRLYSKGYDDPRAEFELSASHDILDDMAKHLHFNSTTSASRHMLNATAVRRRTWRELRKQTFKHFKISRESPTSNLPDLPEDRGFFDRVDKEVYTEKRAANSMTESVDMDGLIEDGRAVQERELGQRAWILSLTDG